MAKIQEEILIIKLSKLVKGTDADQAHLSNEELLANLEAVVQEMLDDESVVVEVERAE